MKHLVLVAAAGLTLFTGCQKNKCIKAQGAAIYQDVTVDPFWGIHVQGSADVIAVKDSIYSMTVLAAPNVHAQLEPEVHQGILLIGYRNGSCVKGGKTTIYITSPDLNHVSISGSGEVIMSDFDETVMYYSISGSGEILSHNCTADDLFISISGSGEVDALQSIALDSDISISGSGDVDLKVIDHLNVEIKGSGDVRYTGNPVVTQNITGSGSVEQY